MLLVIQFHADGNTLHKYILYCRI